MVKVDPDPLGSIRIRHCHGLRRCFTIASPSPVPRWIGLRVVNAVKALEDAVELSRRDADAIVGL